jgi:hypothetical protein
MEMTEKEKKLGGRPRSYTSRLVLRLPTSFIGKMCSMGDQLSLDTPQAAARHFITLGMQASLGALTAQTAVSQKREMLAVLKDMFGGADWIADNPAILDARTAKKGPASNMLDTKRLNRNGKAGQRVAKSKNSSNLK